ncbi:MAG: single-stranded DNA-binding protein [Clostridia bacterium]|nr:single-stranded DNA-binding protein [Clostridia bacterium]
MRNKVRLSGHLKGNFQYSHSSYGREFYQATIEVARLSTVKDEILVVAPKEILPDLTENSKRYVRIQGRFSSHNVPKENGKSRVICYVHARKIEVCEEQENDENDIRLTGYICKAPVLRKTPVSKTDIADLLVAVNYDCRKSDYLWCIAWKRLAIDICKTMQVGSKILLEGRIQSRTYFKGDERRTTYEVSIMTIDE